MRILIFLVKLSLIVVLMIALMFGVIMPQYTTGYNAALIDKVQRLQSIDEPKIILVGDSNVAYGFNSAMISEAFNMPVVNMGLHGGLGQTFHSDMVKPHIREGDIIIIAPLRYCDENTAITDPVLAWLTIENHFILWRGIAPRNYWDMVLAYPTYLRRAIGLFLTGEGNLPHEGSWSRAAFNEYGDNIYPRPKNVVAPGQYGWFFESYYLSQAMRDYWNEYNEFVVSRGATLFMSSPPIYKGYLDIDLAPLQSALERELNFQMISQLEDYVFPFEYFYDSKFHLNDAGVILRTKQLILDLRKALE